MLLGITIYRALVVLLIKQDEDEENDIVHINLFKRGFRTYTIISVGILYPLFVVWILLGTVWYIEVIYSQQACFSSDDTMNWYFLTWIISFYAAAIVISTAIAYSGIVYYRNYLFERQFSSLLEQYEDEERPEMEFTINGLSPDNIRSMPIRMASESDGKCAICLDTFADNMKARELTCRHKYHLICIDKWLMQHTCCPICKTDFNQ